MARKNKKEIVEAPIDKAVEIRQNIANLCTSIGDKSFVIRQAKSEITGFHAQIDQLRDQLVALEKANGPQANPTK